MHLVRLQFLFNHLISNNFQIKAQVTITTLDVHDPLLTSDQLFTIILLSEGLTTHHWS